MLDPDSRYAQLPTATHVAQGGREIVYVTRRFLPRPDALLAIGKVSVAEADRLDLIAARALGDALVWWRLPDANLCEHPDELEQPGLALVLAVENP
jgi:hypothetical protein